MRNLRFPIVGAEFEVSNCRCGTKRFGIVVAELGASNLGGELGVSNLVSLTLDFFRLFLPSRSEPRNNRLNKPIKFGKEKLFCLLFTSNFSKKIKEFLSSLVLAIEPRGTREKGEREGNCSTDGMERVLMMMMMMMMVVVFSPRLRSL